MKKNYRDNNSNEILYKTEELLDAASNRYKMTIQIDRKSTRLNSSHSQQSRMPSSA